MLNANARSDPRSHSTDLTGRTSAKAHPSPGSHDGVAVLPTRFEMSLEAQEGLGLGLGLGRPMAPSPGLQHYDLRGEEESLSLPSIFPSQRSRFRHAQNSGSSAEKKSSKIARSKMMYE